MTSFTRSAASTIALLTMGAATFGGAAAQEMPIFRVDPIAVDSAEAQALLNKIAGTSQASQPKLKQPQQPITPTLRAQPQLRDNQQLQLPQQSPALRRAEDLELDPSFFKPAKGALSMGAYVAEVDEAGGGIYLTNREKIFSLEKVKLPSDAASVEIVRDVLEAGGLLDGGEGVKFDVRAITQTAYQGDGENQPTVTERVVTFGATIDTPMGPIEVTGGGSEYGVAVGQGGEVVSVVGAFRPVTGIAGTVEIASQDDAIAAFKKATELEFTNLEAKLYYHAKPGFERQTELRPVYAIFGSFVADGEEVPLRTTFLDASKLVTIFEPGPEAPKLDKDIFKRDRQRDTDDGEKFGLLDLVFTPAHAAEADKECGAEWIGDSQGLGGSSGNRQGFLDGCRDEGWRRAFDWGNLLMWPSDFLANDDRWVDSVDLLFYTGHAGPSSWTATQPGTTNTASIRNTDLASGLDHWGRNDLEWLIVAACGPHQHDGFVGSTNNAFDRWRSVFDGLHNFLGYGAVTFDNTSEGRRFMELVRRGNSVHEAWFRTAREVQPATNGWSAPNGDDIYVTDMYAHDGDHCAKNERIHGRGGQSCADVRGSGQRRHLWWQGT